MDIDSHPTLSATPSGCITASVLSFRDAEDLLAQRGITVSYEAIRLWCLTFGSVYARRLKRRQGPAGRHLAPGRGLRHHPGTAALSLACRRSRW